MLQEILELIVLVVIFIGILGLTYYVTKKIATMNHQVGVNKNMEIIEVLPLMQGQYLYIVRVGQAYHLVGCTQKGNITYLQALDETQLNLEKVKNKSFQEQLTFLMKGRQVKEDEKQK